MVQTWKKPLREPDKVKKVLLIKVPVPKICIQMSFAKQFLMAFPAALAMLLVMLLLRCYDNTACGFFHL